MYGEHLYFSPLVVVEEPKPSFQTEIAVCSSRITVDGGDDDDEHHCDAKER